MAYLPRGIAPELLVSQVQNTMPYLFADLPPEWAAFPPAEWVRALAGTPHSSGTSAAPPLSHFEYFRLCVGAHYLTCGTPVPTDVDNQIRLKLWPEALPLAVALAMSALVLESRAWDFRPVTRRYVNGADAEATQVLSGHHGEWFTLAAGAYCALTRYPEPEARARRLELLAAVGDEVRRHSEVFGSLWRAGDGLRCLRASAAIAHNFGDLDRVIAMWELSVGDPLALQYGGLTRSPFGPDGKLRYLGRLWTAGELYKSPISGSFGTSSLALENHRHFALRKPRCLRRNPDFMITTAPFLDEWGSRVAQALEETEIREVVAALEHGWDRLPRTVGYGRALAGVNAVRPGLSPRAPTVARERFASEWDEAARTLLDEIPSRA